MKLSISNIGWEANNDKEIYEYMKKTGFDGLEIAPTRIFPQNPYDNNEKAKVWSEELNNEYGFIVPSMQSIWFGRNEKLFGTQEEREILIEYTKKAIDFAASIKCKNLVFGCPRNRFLDNPSDADKGVVFFKEIGDYAFKKGTTIGMEANPPIYNTNYINDTLSAIELIKQVNSDGFLLNLDLGTMIQNNESLGLLIGNVKLVNHVHISEPGLKPIEKRNIHLKLKEVLEKEEYTGFVSIEMGKNDDINVIKEKMEYVKSIFG